MSKIDLETKTKEQEILKAYLEENASNILADKINNGVKIEKDGKTLINRKSLETFMKFATEEAKKQAEKGANVAMIEDKVVFGWLIHYFEEDSIEGILYNEDGSEYKKAITQHTVTTAKVPVKKQESNIISMFDGMDDIYQSADIEEEDGDSDEVVSVPEYSPLYQKFLDYQAKYPNLVIIMKIGDFYEIFGENAKAIGNKFDLTITSRDIGNGERTPMVGYPYHMANVYLDRILKDFSVVVIEDGEEKVYEKIEKLYDSDTFVQVSTGEVIEDTEFDTDIVAKLFSIFGDEMEGY